MNKQELSARAKKAWATRRRVKTTCQKDPGLVRHLAAVKAWQTRRTNSPAFIQCPTCKEVIPCR